MKKTIFYALASILIFSSSYGQSSLWIKTTDERVNVLEKMDRISIPSKYDLYSLDFAAMKSQLQQAPLENLAGISNVIVSFPNAQGELERFKIFEAPIMDPGLASRYPDIKSYYGKGVDDALSTIRFSTTIFGLHVMSLSGRTGTYFIDTYTKDLNNYILYKKSDVVRTSNHFSCLVQDEGISDKTLEENSVLANDSQFRIYRLAMACTIEYAAYHVNAAGVGAGTEAVKKAAVLAAMVVTMTRVNGVYERDMSLRMNFVANNDAIIFITADNFNNNAAGTLIGQSQTEIDAAIGSANYDIGHTVSTGGGGLASLNVPCTANKARGITGSSAPVGDPYDIDYVAHEMGHQFGATHTFNNSCGGNISTGTSVEPGSGTTIMAYAGICAPNVQGNSDDHFHAVSLAQMFNCVTGSGSCPPNNPNGNTPPTADAGPSSYTIPNGTAFILKGAGTDANGDSLTYCWEQTNTPVSTQPPVSTSTSGPNFRSNPPTASPDRYMPVFSEVLNGNLAPTWEVVPTVSRSMTFALTVRDNRMPNGGQTARDNISIVFTNTGPFRISSPNVANTSWATGSTQTVTWDLAGSNAAPINTANVKISYSADGGATFTTLIASTPNDGSESIVVPNTPTATARIMIEAIGNIYYCVSKNILVGFACDTASESPGTAIADGLGANNPGAATVRTLNVTSNVTINDMKAMFASNHTWIGDLVVKLKHPDNTEITLWNRGCNNPQRTGINVTFQDGAPAAVCASPTVGTCASSQALSAFNGKSALGVWTLTVQDFYNGDTGVVSSWGVDFGCTALGNEEFTSDDFRISPNPNTGSFMVQFNSTTGNDIKINVHDIRGREVFNQTYTNTGLIQQNLELQNVSSGVYLVSVLDGDKKMVKKVIVE